MLTRRARADARTMSPGTRGAAWRAYPPWVRAVLGVYVLAFAVGTGTHLDALVHGWWFAHHPLLNAYWTLLVVIDPVVIWLVLRVPRAGVIAALVTMLTDVGINSAVSYLYLSTPGHYAVNDFVQLQTVFLGFVLGSAPFLWMHFSASHVSV